MIPVYVAQCVISIRAIAQKNQHLLPLRGTSLSCHGRFRLATVSRTEANTVGLSRSGSSVRSITGAYRALIELLGFARQGVITLLEM